MLNFRDLILKNSFYLNPSIAMCNFVRLNEESHKSYIIKLIIVTQYHKFLCYSNNTPCFFL